MPLLSKKNEKASMKSALIIKYLGIIILITSCFMENKGMIEIKSKHSFLYKDQVFKIDTTLKTIPMQCNY